MLGEKWRKYLRVAVMELGEDKVKEMLGSLLKKGDGINCTWKKERGHVWTAGWHYLKWQPKGKDDPVLTKPANWSGVEDCNAVWMDPRVPEKNMPSTKPVTATCLLLVKPVTQPLRLQGVAASLSPVQTAWGKQALISHFLPKKYGKAN